MRAALCVIVTSFWVTAATVPTAFAAPPSEAPPPVDWRDFIDHDQSGDHVVGEEMCARPRIR